MSDFTFSTLVLFYLFIFTFYTLSPHFYFHFRKSKQPRRKGEISYLIFLIKFWIAPFGAKTIFTLNNPRLLAPKWSEHFTRSAPPLFILDLLLWIGSAYYFLYINSCLMINKLLKNLTSLRQHLLQYRYRNNYKRKKVLWYRPQVLGSTWAKCYKTFLPVIYTFL